LHLFSASLIIFAGVHSHFGIYYWMGASVFTGLLIYQHSIVKSNNLSRVNLAFFTTNGIASILFAIFVLLELFI